MNVSAGMSWCAASPQSELTTSETALLSWSFPALHAGFVLAYSGLHGPYETAGRPFGIEPSTSRTARTRQRTVAHHPSSR